jgi:phosphoribosylformimino-5-aminoimidazole carboxamide ribotide isomerase
VEAVILFPAVDLKNGQCVRLEQGDMARATVFNLDPAAQARSFAEQGFEYLHVVDLDGAFAGKPMNALAVEAMLKAITMPVQLGGGIRDLKTVEAWLDKGIARVIIGTAAVRDPELVKSAARKVPGRVAVGLDARDGKVAVEGWAETSQVTVLEIAQRFEDAGVAAIIFTDIARDGLLKGLNLDATIALAESISIPVIASGGLASIGDVKAMLEPRAKKLAGAIAGRAPTRPRSIRPRSATANSSSRRRKNSASSASWSRSTPSGSNAAAARTAGRSSPMAGATPPGSTPSNTRRK